MYEACPNRLLTHINENIRQDGKLVNYKVADTTILYCISRKLVGIQRVREYLKNLYLMFGFNFLLVLASLVNFFGTTNFCTMTLSTVKH